MLGRFFQKCIEYCTEYPTCVEYGMIFMYVCMYLLGYRLIGLCLLQNELCPIFLNRHVMKYILGRAIRFHDLAFFDPVIYESLRQLVVDAETKDSNSLFSALDLTFRYEFSDIAVFVLLFHSYSTRFT